MPLRMSMSFSCSLKVYFAGVEAIAIFLVTSLIVIEMQTISYLAVETISSFVPWLANFNIKRNVTSMFVDKKYRY